MKEYAQFWRRARLKSGLSQQVLSERLGFKSGQLVSNVERGCCRYPKAALPDLIEALGVNTEVVVRLILREEKNRLEQALKKICGSE